MKLCRGAKAYSVGFVDGKRNQNSVRIHGQVEIYSQESRMALEWVAEMELLD